MLRVWAAWAILAGLVQLTLGISQRSLGGQWPMILSRGMSAVVGITFALSASDADSLSLLIGHATLGGVFFLISALRLGRAG